MDTKWKRHEREIAQIFGAQRIPHTGRKCADIVTDRLSIEVKSFTGDPPRWLANAVNQAISGATDNTIPIVVLSYARRGRETQRYVVLTLEHFRELMEEPYGSITTPQTE
jgi:hypothetical protein